jgi:arylsulfatase
MTGCYPHQVGVGHMTNTPNNFTQHDLDIPEYRGFLNKSSITIAEVLKEAGYHTLMTGKWHLGISTKDKWPLQRGFNKFYGIVPGASNFFKPEYPRGITYMNDTISVTDENYYTSDAFTDYAIQFINESQEEDQSKPFFLYLAYTAPHWPIQAPQEDVEKYKGKYMDGWTALREKRYQRMIEMGLIDPEWKLPPQDSREWNSLSDEKKEEMDLRMAIYAAMIDRMDQNIGKLTKFLKEKQLFDNTIIIFLNDNGACAEGGELGGGTATQLETKEGYFLTYGRAWANASNTPYREYKHWVHEGGINTPFIIHWPQGIPQKENGTLIKEYGFLPDIMATCIDLAGTEYPKEYKGNKIIPISGKSLLPLLKGEKEPIHTEPLFWEHEGNKAVRMGNYKLVSEWQKNQEYNWELFELAKDGTEMHDLSGEMPEMVQRMNDMYSKWAEKNNVLPWDSVQVLYGNKKLNN